MGWVALLLMVGAIVGTQAQLVDAVDDTSILPCPANEHYECNSNSCQITCENMKYEAIMGACAPTHTCYCNKGYVRDQNGICIKREDCPESAPCGSNEVLSTCYNSCQDRKCKDRYRTDGIMCAQVCNGSACICKPDYYRHDNGTCVAAQECSPPQCGKGEVYNKCGSACPKSCQTKDNTCLVCLAVCVPGCFCAKGTIRGPDGISCVKPEKCPLRKCTGANERFNPCPSTCPRNDKCENLWSKKPCTPIDCCEPKCECKPGFYRNDKNVCVTAKECSPPDSPCGRNERLSTCYNNCQEQSCKNRFRTNGISCPQVCNGAKCICESGFYRHDNGTCVPGNECSPPVCAKGEVYNKCGSSCPKSCANKDNTCLVCTLQCEPGCFCAKGTVRAPNGISCIKPENCPKPKCGANQEFVSCPPTCPRTEECKNLWSKEPCEPIDCCNPQCRCKSGYFRKNGVCVTAQECMANPNGVSEPQNE